MAKRGRVEEETPKLRLMKIPAAPVPKTFVDDCNLIDCPYRRTSAGQYSSYYYGHKNHTHYEYGDYNFAVLEDERIGFYDGPLFKWLGVDGRSSHGGTLWSLPKDGEPGDYMEPDSKLLATCNHGLHALLPGQRGYGGYGRLFVAQAEGPIMFSGYNEKVVAMKLRLLREVDIDLKELIEQTRQRRWDNVLPNLRANYPSATILKDTPEASIEAIVNAAKPLRKEWIQLSIGASKAWPRLRGDENYPPEDRKRRKYLKDTLDELTTLIGAAERRYDWSDLPEDVQPADVKLYNSKYVEPEFTPLEVS